jgi:hypothetical protein
MGKVEILYCFHWHIQVTQNRKQCSLVQSTCNNHWTWSLILTSLQCSNSKLQTNYLSSKLNARSWFLTSTTRKQIITKPKAWFSQVYNIQTPNKNYLSIKLNARYWLQQQESKKNKLNLQGRFLFILNLQSRWSLCNSRCASMAARKFRLLMFRSCQ